jgi:hypothetical protein
MERTGMSWVKAGAQAMLELRSTALNGDGDEFMTFRIEREAERLYLSGMGFFLRIVARS